MLEKHMFPAYLYCDFKNTQDILSKNQRQGTRKSLGILIADYPSALDLCTPRVKEDYEDQF